MSDYSQGPGWWQASDGRWYPPEQAPATPQTAYGQPGQPYGQAQPYGQPSPYPQPGPYPQGAWGGPAAPKTDGLAIASLVTSLVGAVLVVFCIGLIGTIAGFVMGLVARSRIAKSDGQLTGSGLALAGIIVGAAATVLYIGLIVAVGASRGFSSNTTP